MKFCKVLRERRRQRMQKDDDKTQKCKYPIGDPQSIQFKFCCAPIEHARFVYCDNHARLCYTNFEDIKDKPRRAATAVRNNK